jgi:eukaryotic-like serine/threonine-protein kinase
MSQAVPERLATALSDRYRIERELGQGGMATVYLAHDVRHDRKVAIKVLRPELAAVIGAERFLREIKTIANLQHPHILGLIDSGEVNGTAYYVMPFVEGESLRDRLNRDKQLPVTDAVRFAGEVAAALDYAHRHSVIHRDIKPENVMLHDGSALVTDFGIALAVSSAGGSRMTETGMSLGTPHYMSPEQAMGEREITARSDIYALGAITYEMLLGEPPFSGPTAQAIVAKVLTEQPRPLTAQRRTIPEEVEAAVLTALEKLPADRFGSAAEFATALRDGKVERRKREGTRTRPASRRPIILVVLGMLALAAAAFTVGRMGAGTGAPPMVFGPATKVTWEAGVEILPAISPDGKSVAYGSGNSYRMQIFVRPVAGGRSIRLTDDTTGVQAHPRWSPDGTRILFLAGGGVLSAPSAGGPARPEVPPGQIDPVGSAAYAPDGKSIAFVIGDSLFVRAEDGTSRPLAVFYEPNVCSWSPDGRLIACGSGNSISMDVSDAFGNISPSSIVICRVSDGRVTRVTDSLTLNQTAIWSPDSRWIYFISNRDGPRDIYGLRITGSGEAKGDPVRLTTGLGAHSVSLSADGRRLAYSSFSTMSNIWSLRLTGSLPVSREEAVKITVGNQSTENTNASRDGKWLFFDSDLSGNMDVYRLALPGGTPERLTTDPSDDFAPQPSPDGREVVFHSWRGGSSRDIYVLPLDGGPTQRVTDTPLQEALAAWSRDGTALAYAEFTGRGGVWISRRVNGSWGAPVRRLDHGFWANWSPDGRYLVYTTDIVAGSLAVLPVDSGPPRIVMDGSRGILADKSFWTDDGKSLVFRGRDTQGRRAIYTIPIAGGPPRLVAWIDPEGSSTLRGGWGYSGDRMYFSADELQSDVLVLEVKQP